MDKKEKQKEKLEWILNQECDVKLIRREVIAIHNILASLQYKLGDAEIVLKILGKLNPHAVVETNISKEEHDKQIAESLTLGKKESN